MWDTGQTTGTDGRSSGVTAVQLVCDDVNVNDNFKTKIESTNKGENEPFNMTPLLLTLQLASSSHCHLQVPCPCLLPHSTPVSVHL